MGSGYWPRPISNGMKIGIDSRMYGVKATTGIGVYIKNLTDELFKIDQKNQYVLFMKDPEYSAFQVPNERVSKVKVDIPWYSLKEQLVMPRILKKYKLDLVHFPHFNVPILYKGKYIVTIHDITPKFFPGPLVKKSLIRKFGYNLIFNIGLKKAKKILTNSNYTKKNIIKYFNTNPEKLTTIHLGFDKNLASYITEEKIQEIKNKLNISKPFLFYVGVWRDHKNLPGLVKAFNILKSKYNLDIQLVLAGSQDSRYPEIKQEINQSKFKKDIITPGFIKSSDLPLLYKAAKLFVLPSYAEGFGLVALEAQSLNTPVIASSTTSLPEILEDSAIYFNPHDQNNMAEVINKVISNKNLYSDLQQRGLIQVKKYSWRTTAKQTLSVYQDVKNMV